MPQPRSSLAMALQDYKGPRPGIALTIAAVALVIAMVVGAFHLIGLSRSAALVSESRHGIETLNRYNATLEVWRQMATDTLEFEAQRRLRDSLAYALRTDLAGLRDELTDSTDRALVGTILTDLDASPATPSLQLGVAGREPGTRCDRHPWVSLPPEKPQRFTTPAKPRPLLRPVTATLSPMTNTSDRISWPNSKASAFSTGISRRCLNIRSPAFFMCPRRGLLIRPSFWGSNPTWIASYPSLSDVFLWITTQGSTLTMVTGILFPSSKK